MFTALMECQRDIYNLTLQQYRLGSLLESCAIASGLQPEPIVTLNSDVLGRLVFSALGQREQAGGYAEDDRNRFLRMTANLLDQGGGVARNANVLFDPNLSNAQKASQFGSSVVNEYFGGPVPFAISSASLLLNFGQFVKQGVDAAAKTRAVADQKKLRQIIEAKSSDFRNVKGDDLIAKVAEQYNIIKTQNDELIRFFQSGEQQPTSNQDLKTAKGNVEKLQELLADLVRKEYVESEQSIQKALLVWFGTNFESMKNILIPGHPTGLGLPVNLLHGQTQKKLTDIVTSIVTTCAPNNPLEKKNADPWSGAAKLLKSDLPPERVDKLKSQLRKEVQTTSVQMLEAFRKESVVLRFVLQELLRK